MHPPNTDDLNGHTPFVVLEATACMIDPSLSTPQTTLTVGIASFKYYVNVIANIHFTRHISLMNQLCLRISPPPPPPAADGTFY